MVFQMALFASLCSPIPKACLGGRCVIQSRTMAYLALDIFQARGIQFADKAAIKVIADHMANQTFWIECLINFS